MRRVVVTGLGIVSPIGNNADEVLTSLKAGKSGIEASPEMAEHGFRSQIAGTVKLILRIMLINAPCGLWVLLPPMPILLWPRQLPTPA